jgi:hypothetical protein
MRCKGDLHQQQFLQLFCVNRISLLRTLFDGRNTLRHSLGPIRASAARVTLIEEAGNEPRLLVAGSFRTGFRQLGGLPRVHRGLRANLTEVAVIYATDLIVVLLFAYLAAALVRPEWF